MIGPDQRDHLAQRGVSAEQALRLARHQLEAEQFRILSLAAPNPEVEARAVLTKPSSLKIVTRLVWLLAFSVRDAR